MFQQLNHAHRMIFDLMSPSTLAGLIHDIEDLGDGAEPYALDIARAAREALDANCGAEAAARYLTEAGA